MEFEKHPPIREYLEGLEYLRDTDFSNLKYSDIRKEYFQRTLGHFSAGGHLNEKDAPGMELYRVRSEKSISTKENLNLIQTFSFPPSNICKNGRANIEGHPVFYCTDHLEAAIKESCMSVGEIGYVSIWRLRLRRELQFATYLPKLLPQKNTWSSGAIYFNSIVSAFLSHIPLEVQEHKKAQYEFIIEKFLSESNPYNITSMICHSDLYESGDVDFVVYPSSKTVQNYCNFAFHPNVAQNNLLIDRVIRFKIVSDTEENLKVVYGEVGNRRNDRLKWDHYEKNPEIIEFDPDCADLQSVPT